ncbi:MAG TPA: LrgB family protein [Xanthobacteraceae bacterium]|jgi:predicted murein hydrolase (TIGR00659 family)|nr:MAG: murein hydrolase effector protein LrgB [Rhizobiales bacterium 35-66-30]OZA98645.1 MAG: murein hydrolase effector protein LrgB [Rhizobiales bacterium 39-66-18]HQS09186.1 LrgB family protein [Xanthobacteraceae bacterium]HQS47958.1 LrgB family protein [Xanthobacteraceae bacterium]
MPEPGPLFWLVFWPVATIGLYALARVLNRRFARWFTAPLLLTPVLILSLTALLHTSYADYLRGTHWLVLMLGPATVAFAIPIHEQRATIRRHWPVLLVGVLAGSTIALGTAWGLANLLGLPDVLGRSLMPRSTTTPFAMSMSGEIGGIPDLTAMFVVVTGICGATLGEVMLKWLPLRSSLARGALFGMGAHGAGVAKAHQIGREEGSIAGLVMILAGFVNLLLGPLVAIALR